MRTKALYLVIATMTALVLMGCPAPFTLPTDTTITLLTVPGVTAPATGEKPAMSLDTKQYTGTIIWNPDVSETFSAATSYTATVTLIAKAGYTLTGVESNSFTVAGATSVTHESDSGVVTAVFPSTKAETVTLLAISIAALPEKGETPVTSLDASQYTGTISWSPEVSGTFAAATIYTAQITLIPKAGYTLSGVAANSFTVDGASSVTHDGDSGIVSAVFPSTSAATISLSTIPGVTEPSRGETPVRSLDASQYTGTITWSPEVTSTFAAVTVYTAQINLTPKAGFTLAGVAANSFTVEGASSVTHNPDSGVVLAEFPSTSAATITLLAIPGVTAPATGGTPETILDASQYTGTISWSPEITETFAAATTYSATVTLTAKVGYTLTGIAANSFTVDGASNVTHSTDSGIVSVVFPSTAATIDLGAIPGVTAPVTGAIPVTSLDSSQYTGIISWSPTVAETFGEAVYTAQISLCPKAGYTLTGVEANSFTVEGASSVIYSADLEAVTATFPAAASLDYTSANIGTLKYVPAGRFQRDYYATHISEITQAYRMSQYEITRGQFKAIMGKDPNNIHPWSSGMTCPVFSVNWCQAIAFCNKLSLAEGLTPVYSVTYHGTLVDWSTVTYDDLPNDSNPTRIEEWGDVIVDWNADGYRLPTEMEWLWAFLGAPAGGQGGGIYTKGVYKAFSGSTGSNAVGDYAVFGYYSDEPGSTTTEGASPVGSKKPNELDLYDMSGNVKEFSWDWDGPYPADTLIDYRGPASGTYLRSRGGYWELSSTECKFMSGVSLIPPDQSTAKHGFRVVRR